MRRRMLASGCTESNDENAPFKAAMSSCAFEKLEAYPLDYWALTIICTAAVKPAVSVAMMSSASHSPTKGERV